MAEWGIPYPPYAVPNCIDISFRTIPNGPSAGGGVVRRGGLILRAVILVFATVMLCVTPSKSANAAVFGYRIEPSIIKLTDVAMHNYRGHVRYLGHKMTVYSFIVPIFMTDDGYVLATNGDDVHYIPLNSEQISALQEQNYLPTPLPNYKFTWQELLYYFQGSLILIGAAAGVFVFWRMTRRRYRGAIFGRPLTVAAMATRRSRVTPLLIGLPILTILALVYWSSDDWKSILYGPRKATVTEILAAHAIKDGQEWFEIREKPVFVGGLSPNLAVEADGRKKAEAYFYVLPGQTGILIASKRSNVQPPFRVWLSSIRTAHPILSNVRAAGADLGHRRLAPFMLIVADQNVRGVQAGTAILVALVTIPLPALLLIFFRAIRGLKHPLETPAVMRLLQSVRAREGLDKLIAEVDAQAAAANLCAKSDRTFLLPSWAIDNALNFTIMSLEDVIWIFPHTVTARNRFGMIAELPRIMVADRIGRCLTISVGEMKQNLYHLCAQAPWALVGPDREMLWAFGDNTRPLLSKIVRFSGLRAHMRAKVIRDNDWRRAAYLASEKAAGR